MEIKSASFIISSPSADRCPEHQMPEYAFIGRSNVGKSSLINMLTNRKNLAKTSSTPGKTQLINHFLINENWHLVDLPGYGYARTSKAAKKIFQGLITSYFLNRKQLVTAFVLVDSRHEPQSIDLEFMTWLGQNSIPFSIVFTKLDKLRPKIIDQNLDHYLRVLSSIWEPLPPYFLTSSKTQTGRKEILDYIDHLNRESLNSSI